MRSRCPEGSPTGYGLGRAGWVTITLSPHLPPRDVLTDWIMESYRCVAPKSLAPKLTGADGRLAHRLVANEGSHVGSVIKKRRKRMAKKKHRKLLKKTRVQRRNKK